MFRSDIRGQVAYEQLRPTWHRPHCNAKLQASLGNRVHVPNVENLEAHASRLTDSLGHCDRDHRLGYRDLPSSTGD